MSIRKKVSIFVVFHILVTLAGCALGTSTDTSTTLPPIAESYEYATQTGWYFQPSVYDPWIEASALTTTTEDGTFFCMTENSEQANDFIVAQRTLLCFLRENGVQIGNLEYYATNYDDSFSRSSERQAYISLSSIHTQQQVLVTLQSLWGDYTEFGYVWAVSNAIATELGWETDSVDVVQKPDMDAFFRENAVAVNLLYPTFSTAYASAEAVTFSKVLAASLLECMDWRTALAKSVEAQIADWQGRINTYATEIGIFYTPQTIGYSYYGEKVPLRIMTTYVEMMVADNFTEKLSGIYQPYFSDYKTIYYTLNTMDNEIDTAVEFFGLEDDVGTITMKWVNFNDSTAQRYLSGYVAIYHAAAETAYISTIYSYLHEYYHHLRYVMTEDFRNSWQSESFCEMGGANSYWRQYRMEVIFGQEPLAELFYECTGRTYQSGRDDYYETADILCYINDSYTLKYHDGGPTISISHYLIDIYGEEIVYDLMLYPETVEEVTGKSWQQWQEEWSRHIREKYAGVEVPDWV